MTVRVKAPVDPESPKVSYNKKKKKKNSQRKKKIMQC